MLSSALLENKDKENISLCESLFRESQQLIDLEDSTAKVNLFQLLSSQA